MPTSVERPVGRNASSWPFGILIAVGATYAITLMWAVTSGYAQVLASRPIRPEAVFLYSALLLLAAFPFALRFLYSNALMHDLRRAAVAMRKARDMARVNAAAKSDFLATMSHELRTPLNAVIGFAGLLEHDVAPTQRKEYLAAIKESSTHLLTIISDILDFSKIEAGRIELAEKEVEVSRLLEGCIKTVQLRASPAVKLAYNMGAKPPTNFIGDATRIRQVLLNLLSNALKFTERGEVALSVQQIKNEAGDPLIRFEVRDTGIGISPADQKKLFQGYTQIASAGVNPEGTGLGLAISHRLCTIMGGSLTVRSQKGRGSTFIATLPAPELLAPPTKQAPASWAGLRVLILNSDPHARARLDRSAQAWGMVTRCTSNRARALNWVQAGDPFDLAVICSTTKPEEPADFGRRLQEASQKPLPLVLVTEEALDAKAAPFVSTISVPLDTDGIYAGFARAIRARKKSAKPTASAARRTLRILVVEDNALNRMLAVRVLDQLGHRADLVENGAEAVKAVTQNAYDVVLMDVQMPVMDGLEASRKLYRTLPPHRRPLIIGLSANALPDDREECLRAGMDDYMAKPMDQARLGELLVNAGQRRRSHTGPRASAT